eukprot:3229783-Rhodomonas_salina.1
MYNALSEIYYWLSMYKDVHKYCTSCYSRTSNKPRNYSPLGPAQQVAIPDLPWTTSLVPSLCPVAVSWPTLSRTHLLRIDLHQRVLDLADGPMQHAGASFHRVPSPNARPNQAS